MMSVPSTNVDFPTEVFSHVYNPSAYPSSPEKFSCQDWNQSKYSATDSLW